MNDSISNHPGPGSHAEPSMEEILASIRRILKDEDSNLPVDQGGEEDLLVLHAGMIAPADIRSATELPAETGALGQNEPAPAFYTPAPAAPAFAEPPAPPEYAEPAAAAEPEPPAPEAAPEPTPEPTPEPGEPQHGNTPENAAMNEHQLQEPDGLIGQHAANEIANTIGAMVRSVAQERAVAVSRMGTTIEDIVREELRPILKSWLDTHLPSLVERIVRAEIERVIDRSQL